MKRLYRLLALLTALVFCMTAVPVSAAADATVTVGNVAAKAGETVTVPVSISHLENIASIGLHVEYDPAVLKCVSAEMSDAVASMDMANANTKPVRNTDRVILTAVSLKPVVLDGVVMTVTFEVLSDAPHGVTPVKVLDEGLSVSTTDLVELSVDVVDGGVTVGDVSVQTQGTSAEDPTSATKSDTVTTAPKDTDATTVKNEDSANNTDGEDAAASTTASIELPEQTVVDVVGNIVTDVNGEPTKVKAIGVFIGSATASPEETVTVRVSLTDVTDLTAVGLSVHYNAAVLSFESGECVGFVKDNASMSSVLEHESGIVDISAMASNGMSGSGEIAELRFKVKNTAKNGEYRLSIKGEPLLQAKTFEYPVKIVAGQIRVEGAATNNSSGLYAALGIVAAAAALAFVVWICLRRKKSAPVQEAPKTPVVIDVSGEDEE